MEETGKTVPRNFVKYKYSRKGDAVMQYEVSVIGAAIIDVLAGPINEKLFQTGSLPVETVRMSFGGDALNEAVVLSQLGTKVELISKVGNDEAGKRVLSFLQEKGVGLNVSVDDRIETGINIVLIDENRERRFLTNPVGSLRKLSEEDVMARLDNLGNIVCMASIFVSPMLDIPAMERIFKEIKKKEGRILIADMTTAKNGESIEDIKCLLPWIDYIIPNETEAGHLTGETDASLSAKSFLEHGANCVMIKLGARGCLIKNRDEEYVVPAYAKAKAVDTTGAGDSFVAGFTWGLSKGMSVKESVRFGCATASCTVECVGANSAVKSVDVPMQRYLKMREADMEKEITYGKYKNIR